MEIAGKIYFGKSLYDALEGWIRKGRYSTDERERQYGRDIMWFVWSNENSPLYGKDKMTTFERYFLADKESYAEEKNAYYRLCDDEETVERIFREFGIDPDKGHIINGHVPVKVKKGNRLYTAAERSSLSTADFPARIRRLRELRDIHWYPIPER